MTESTPAEDPRYQRAKERARDVRSFYVAIGFYVVVNVVLFLINLVTRGEGGGWWFYWVTVFWGIAMIFWGFNVFVSSRPASRQWEEKKIRQYMEEEEGTPPPEDPIS